MMITYDEKFSRSKYKYRVLIDGKPETKWFESRYAALRNYTKGKHNNG